MNGVRRKVDANADTREGEGPREPDEPIVARRPLRGEPGIGPLSALCVHA